MPGLRCFILSPVSENSLGRGALVAWNEGAAEGDAVLHAYLGPGPVRVVDLYGNSTDAPLRASGADGGEPGSETARRPEVAVPIGAEPVFIEGIDPMLTRFLASVRDQMEVCTYTLPASAHATRMPLAVST